MEDFSRVLDVAELPNGALLILIGTKSRGFFDSIQIMLRTPRRN